MKVAKIVLYLTVMAVLTFSSTVFAQSYDYKEMKMDEYNALLQEWQGRLQAANDAIVQEDQRIETAKKCNDDTQAEVNAVWDEIYAALGTNKEAAEAYKQQVAQLRSDVSAFLNLSPEEIYRRKDEMKALKDRLAGLRADNLALLSENMAALDAAESMIKQAEEKGKPVAQVAINWIVQQSGVTTAIVGARTPEQVEMNAAAGKWELSKDDLNRIDFVYQQIFAEKGK